MWRINFTIGGEISGRKSLDFMIGEFTERISAAKNGYLIVFG
jgi:hypothetical protein